ncbi:MAG TPA: response regulator transcription factor, partial [Thermomicrobiales bacterium]|nr:response regulator transcription factor [Thermomicrobiales bacterium]
VALHELGEITRSEDVARGALARAVEGGFVRALAVPGFDATTMFAELWNERRDLRHLKHALQNLKNAPPRPLAHTLTKRELEIVQLLAQGKSNNQIAGETFISVNTVRNHLAKIYSKLEVISRSEAVARACQLDILD